jgi:hypothetical protein
MLVMADNDVGGAVAVLRRILESADNAAWLEILGVAFTDFESLDQGHPPIALAVAAVLESTRAM